MDRIEQYLYVLIVKKGLLSVGGSIYQYYGCTARLPKWFDFWTLSSRSMEQSTEDPANKIICDECVPDDQPRSKGPLVFHISSLSVIET